MFVIVSLIKLVIMIIAAGLAIEFFNDLGNQGIYPFTIFLLGAALAIIVMTA